MKFSAVYSVLASLSCVTAANAFIPLPPASMSNAVARTPPVYATTSVELVAEPEGGVELIKVSDTSLPGSRMKNMVR